MKFYVIRTSEDGDVSIEVYSKDGLERALDDGDYDADEIADTTPPPRFDLAAEAGVIIIKGELVHPKPYQVTTKFKVE